MTKNCPICNNPLTLIYEEIMDTYLMEREESCQDGCRLYKEHYITGSTKISVYDKEFSWHIYDNPDDISLTELHLDYFIRFIQANLLTLDRIKDTKMLTFPETDINFQDLPSGLKWFRQMRQMTLKETAEKTGLSISFLSDLERGQVNPSLLTLKKLINAYKSPVSIHFSISSEE